MLTRTIIRTAVLCTVLVASSTSAVAQIVEAVGERALGMGGAFVAVASDSSAVWWNPAALADGPFVDLSIGRATSTRDFTFPAGRDRVSGFALSTPVIGVGFHRFVLDEAAGSTGQAVGDRQNEQASAGLRSWSASALGVTIVQTLTDGTHVGATVKYARGRLRTGIASSGDDPEAALDRAGELEGGTGEGQFDVDLGGLTVAGPIRLGFVVRNVRGAEFEDGAFRLPRQARIGVAYSAEQSGGPPLTLSVDADLKRYEAGGGFRRVVAVGVEHWLAAKRIGLRAGARFNRVGHAERALTAGASLALRRGSFFEAHVVGGGSPAERGWGTGVRVSF